MAVAVSGQSVTLSWDDTDVSGISYQYRVNHNDTGTGKLSGWGSWQDINNPSKTGSRFSYTVNGHTLGKEYRYKIRAVNIGGGSKPAPAASPWYVAAIIPDPRPPALSNLWTVRVCDDLFKVRWHFVPGATGYDLEMSGNHRQSWQRKMTNKNYNAWQFSQWTKNATFWFRVRAVNSNGASEWRYVKSKAPPCAVEGLQASYANGEISASWQPAKRATGYDVNFSADNGRSWQRMKSNISATSATFTKDPQALPYNPNFLVAVQSRKGNLTSGWRNAPIDLLVQLTAGNITSNSATLNLSGHSGDWYIKKTAPTPAGACSSAISGTTHNLSNLSLGTTYTYMAYSDSGCSTALDSVTFTGVSVSNLDKAKAGFSYVGRRGINKDSSASAFTTGSNNGGYNLQSVTISMGSIQGEPTGFTAAIHASSSGNPATNATYTLTGESQPANGHYTYTCSGACSLDADASYFLVMSATGPGSGFHYYVADYTSSDIETNAPAGAGWSIADAYKFKNNDNEEWQTSTSSYVHKFKVTAAVK